MPFPCKTLGARAGSLNRNLVAHARDLGAPGDRAPVRQQPCLLNGSYGLENLREQSHVFYCRWCSVLITKVIPGLRVL